VNIKILPIAFIVAANHKSISLTSRAVFKCQQYKNIHKL